jgi:hypothetical protein
MHEFQTFVYLGVQKTGTTFISAMLDQFSKEPQVRRDIHRPMEPDYDDSKFYFITVRDPIDAYLSLYSYGSEELGNMRNKLERKGADTDFYDGTMDGFKKWLAFVLKPKNAEIMDRLYARLADGEIAKLIGLQSYRYLRLAVPDPVTTLGACRTEDDIRAVYKAKKLPRYIVRYEHFVPDLIALVRGPLAYAIKDVDAAVKFIETAPPINTSNRVDSFEEEIKLGRRLTRQYLEREWFLHEEFGY